MAQGLQIIGDHGVVQIDQDYSNLVMIAKGTHSWSAYDGSFTLTLPTVATPLLAIRTSTPVWVYTNNAIGTTSYVFYSSSAGSCTYYLFDKSIAATGSHGLQVFKANGELAYHSSWPILRIGNMVQVTHGMSVGASTSVGAPYGGTWAAVLTSSRFKAFMVSAGQHARAWDALACTDSGATCMVQQIAPISGVLVADQPHNGHILLVDVTGY